MHTQKTDNDAEVKKKNYMNTKKKLERKELQ